MKISKNKIRIIFIRLITATLIWAVVAAAFYLGHDFMGLNHLTMTIIIISSPIVSIFITYLSIGQKAEKIISRRFSSRDLKLAEKKRNSNHLKTEKARKKLSLSVTKIELGSEPMTMLLHFNRSINNKQMPLVRIQNQPVGAKRVNSQTMEVSFSRIDSTAPLIEIKVGDFSQLMVNPFCIMPDKISWCCKGDLEVRTIILYQDFENLSDIHPYQFELHVDGKYWDTLNGYYDKALKSIIVYLGRFKWCNYQDKPTLLKIGHDKNHIIHLPKPSETGKFYHLPLSERLPVEGRFVEQPKFANA